MTFHVTSAPKHTAGLRRFAIGRLFAILQQLQQGISPKFPLLPTHRHPHSLNHTCAHPLAHKLTSRQPINPSTPTHQHPHTRIPAQAVLADFRGRGGKTASSVSLSQRVCLACENTTVCRHASHVYACLTCLYMLALPRPPSRRHIRTCFPFPCPAILTEHAPRETTGTSRAAVQQAEGSARTRAWRSRPARAGSLTTWMDALCVPRPAAAAPSCNRL